MPRKKIKINPKQSERLKLILKEQDITQKELSKQIYLSEKMISVIINGKASITYDTATKISDLFPDAGYRYQWLMGYDDHKTNRDLLISLIMNSGIEDELLYSGVAAFIKLSGYAITFDCEKNEMAEGNNRICHKGYVISRDGQAVILDLSQFNHFANKINDYVDFELQHMI